MDEYRDEIIKTVRSCLISTKGQVTLRQLEDDYRTLIGDRIPYQKLGYRNLESFLQSVPTLITNRSPNGEVYVDAKINEKTAHISSMIRKQKSTNTRKKVKITPQMLKTKFKKTIQQQQQPPTTPKWRPKKTEPSQQYNNSNSVTKLMAVSHNQFINGGTNYKKPIVPSKVVVVNRSNNHSENNNVKKFTSNTKELRRYNSSPESNDSCNVGESGEYRDDCSPLQSTMKRISRIMSSISMERDSGNSSPTTEFSSNLKLVQEPVFTKTGDPIIDLRNFAQYHKLGEIDVKFTETKSKKSKIAQCHCKITVGQHKYSSYPEDFFDEKSAEKHASQKALDDLFLKYNKRRSLLLSSNDDILERIPAMLEKYNNAVWMWQIEDQYIDKYNEQLPPHWLQVTDNNPNVLIEKCLGGYILKHCSPEDKGKKLEVILNMADVSVPCNTVNFGENNRWYAIVTAALSANEIWCQQCGTPEYERFMSLNDKMEEFYTKHKDELKAKKINFGSCYVIQQDDAWLRVRALSMLQENIIDCFLIDYGEQIQVDIDSIYLMKREYAVEQAQAFVCRLHGLEDLYDVSIDSEHLNSLIGHQFVLEVVLEESTIDNDVILPVVMYDIQTGDSINQDLINKLTIESALPVIDKNTITEVYVSHIESNGDIYVQVRSFGYYRLQELLKCLTDSISKTPPTILAPPPTKENSNDKLYLIRCNITQKWQRAKIIDWSPKGDLAQVYFIDIGNAQVINVTHEKIYQLDKLDNIINKYPSQAIKVRIMIEKFPSDFLEKTEKLLPLYQSVLMKINSYDREGVAWVEFFKRTNEGVLLFINKSISVEAELQSFDCGNTANDNRRKLINLVQFGDATKTAVPSGGSLKKPDLPKIGEYFNVNVPFAVNPYNFFVQPLDTFKQLTSMMAEMQNYYKELKFSPIGIEEVTPGKIYASKHEDGLWYRTSVLKVIHSGSISVFYCDFGYYTSLTLAQLVPLHSKYMSLPYQALKAKISGIKPIKDKWTMEDCDFFNNLVTKKHFVSILVNIEKDELYKSDIVLQLILIDTSSDVDVNIKEVLIERGIAMSV